MKVATKPESTSYTRMVADNLAAFAYSDIPSEVIARSKLILLDTVGALLAASAPKYSTGKIITDFVKTLGGEPQATVIGRDFKTSTVNAALANGTLGYLCDIEAHHPEAVLHPVAVAVPSCLAVAEDRHASGEQFLASVVLGVEMGVRACVSLDARGLYRRGFHPSGVGGVFGSVAGAGHLLGLESDRWIAAIGLAANQASGTLSWASDATENSRPFNPGIAARNGVTAALLAHAGFGGPNDVFEGKYDLFTAFSDTRHPEVLCEGWGQRFAIMELAVKRYPCCAFIHSGLDGLFDILAQEHLKIEDISGMSLRFAPSGAHIIDNNIMRSHCAQYVLSIAALEGRFEADDILLYDRRSDPRVLELSRRTKVVYDEDLEKTYPEHYESIIEVATRNGAIFRRHVRSARGLPDNPMTQEEVHEKFLALATTVVSQDRAERIIELVDRIEEVNDIRDLSDLLVVKP